MKLKVIITGGAGFIGSSVYDALKEKYETYIIDNFSPFYPSKQKLGNLKISGSILKRERQQNIFNCDIRDYHQTKKIFSEVKPDAVIHCAAMAGVQPSFEHPKEYFSVNVDGTFNIFSVASEAKAGKVLFLSSSSVYGDNKRAPFKESYLPSPISPYGMTKVLGEDAADFFSKNMGIDIVTLRLFTLYGPRQRPDLLIHKLFLNHIEGRESVIYPKTSRDYTYIDDGVQGIVKGFSYLLEHRGCDVFNIGSSAPIETERVAREMKAALGGFSYRTEEKKRGDVKRTFADISRAEKILSYKPKMDFKEGFKRSYAWLREFYRI